jgi:hypothetical protein
MQKPLDISLLLETISELLLEAPEQRLKRLVGIERSTRCFHPTSATSSVAHSKKRERKQQRVPHHL